MQQIVGGILAGAMMGVWILVFQNWATILAVIETIFSIILIGVVLFIVIGVLRAIGHGAGEVAKWADDALVKHPAEPIVSPALREGRELDTAALHDALMPRQSDLTLSKPLYHYEHQTEKARALTAKLNADAELAQAAMRRERAREALHDAERDFEEAQRRARGRSS